MWFPYIPGYLLTSILFCTGEQGKGAVIFEDLAIHDVDFILWMLDNDKAVSIHSMGESYDASLKALKCPEVAVSMIKFASGVVATVDVGFRSKYGYDIRTEVKNCTVTPTWQTLLFCTLLSCVSLTNINLLFGCFGAASLRKWECAQTRGPWDLMPC